MTACNALQPFISASFSWYQGEKEPEQYKKMNKEEEIRSSLMYFYQMKEF